MTTAPGPDHQPEPEAVAPSVSFACAGCGKTVKARAELAGKKVKCPQCGQVIPVPPSNGCVRKAP
jgi:DNA-directed RNA polymerase subunit RPC12/RpoP